MVTILTGAVMEVGHKGGHITVGEAMAVVGADMISEDLVEVVVVVAITGVVEIIMEAVVVVVIMAVVVHHTEVEVTGVTEEVVDTVVDIQASTVVPQVAGMVVVEVEVTMDLGEKALEAEVVALAFTVPNPINPHKVVLTTMKPRLELNLTETDHMETPIEVSVPTTRGTLEEINNTNKVEGTRNRKLVSLKTKKKKQKEKVEWILQPKIPKKVENMFETNLIAALIVLKYLFSTNKYSYNLN